jgi:hypothetical protein
MSDTIYTDEDGLWFSYVCSYKHQGQEYGFTLWARNLLEAEAHLRSLALTGMVNGRLVEELPVEQGGKDQ